jgi:hypothetical protein
MRGVPVEPVWTVFVIGIVIAGVIAWRLETNRK